MKTSLLRLLHKSLVWKILLVLVVIAISILLFSNYILTKTGKTSKATGESVALSFDQASLSGGATATLTPLKIMGQPNTNISVQGYEFAINFNKDNLEVVTITYPGACPLVDGYSTTVTQANSSGSIRVACANTSIAGFVLASAQTTELVQVTFKSKIASSSNITIPVSPMGFSLIETTGLRIITGPVPPALTVTTGNAPTATPTPTPPPGATATPTPTTPPGATATPTPTPIPPTPTPTVVLTCELNGGKCGALTVNGVICPSGYEQGGSGTCAVGAGCCKSILTPTPTPTGNFTLNLKLKFQGITKKPSINTMNVQVKIGGSGSNDYRTATFTSDDKGVWSGTVRFDPMLGSGYIVYVKGPKHLQKKTCVATPTETAPGTYNCGQGTIALASGANTFDFSGVLQLVGDLPEQDGVINSYDYSLIRNNLNTQDPAVISLADVNFDGKVDTQDASLVLAALSVKQDEQ